MTEISVVIPTANRNPSLSVNIEQMLAVLAPYTFEIIVVNDRPQSDCELSLSDARLRIHNGPGKGAASARNFGARLAKYSTLLFIDDDIVLSAENFVAFFSRAVSALPSVITLPDWKYPPSLIAECRKTAFGRFLLKHRFHCLAGYINRDNFAPGEIVPHDAVASYFLLIDRQLFTRIGGYNENIPFAGFEDHDLSAKIRHAGVKILVDASYFVFHDEREKIVARNWFQRIKHGAVTRKQASLLGYDELKLHYPAWKVLGIKCLLPFEKIILKLLNIINFRIFDPLAFTAYKILIALNIFKGYRYTP